MIVYYVKHFINASMFLKEQEIQLTYFFITLRMIKYCPIQSSDFTLYFLLYVLIFVALCRGPSTRHLDG